MEKLYRILARNDTCVLLERKNSIKYKVVDIENDTLYYGVDLTVAKKIFNEYNLEKVREEKKSILESWLKENAEA